MANKVDAKLTDLGNKRTAKVKEIREVEANLRPSSLSDSERLSLNNKLNRLTSEREILESKYNELAKVASTAKEYVKLNDELRKINENITRAKARGEDTTSYEKRKNTVSNRISAIAPEVETVFPEIKVNLSKTITSENKEIPKAQTLASSAAALGLPTSSLPKTTSTAETPVKDPTKIDQIPLKTPDLSKDKKTPALTDTQQREQALGLAEGADFALPETIFNNVPSLKTILERYVAEDWTADKLRKAIRDDVWYRQNSGAIKQRYVQLFNYRDLVKTGQAQGTTQYEQDIVKLERQIADKARQVGSGIASDPAALRKAAENMYITNVGIDDAMTTDFIAAAIRPVSGMIGGKVTEGYSGQALQNYNALLQTARNNGFQISDILPGGANEQQVLSAIASGTIDINRVAQDARKLAAQGQPQYVRDLLAQGYDLAQVFAPYRKTMANILEIDDPNQIDLNDPTLRMAITDKGDMNVYDFKKALKADNRWQYTENARNEVSTAAFNVLRDFGFQG
jgi:hypothetical protein